MLRTCIYKCSQFFNLKSTASSFHEPIIHSLSLVNWGVPICPGRCENSKP